MFAPQGQPASVGSMIFNKLLNHRLKTKKRVKLRELVTAVFARRPGVPNWNAFQSPNYVLSQAEGSPNHSIFLNSLLIPCFWTQGSQKTAIHAGFHARPKKFPVIFPVLREMDTAAEQIP